MVVLQHDPVEEPEAVIPAAAAGHRVLLKHAVAGGRFSRIQQSGTGFAKCVDVAAGLGGDVDGGHAATDDDDATTDGQAGQVAVLAQILDVAHGVEYTGNGFVGQAQGIDRTQTRGKKHRIEIAAQLRKSHVDADALANVRGDAADRQQPVDLALRDIVLDLVGSDAVLVETAEFGPRFEHADVVAEHGQPVRARQAGRAAADHGDALATGRRTREQCLAAIKQRVGGVALQQSDRDGLVLGGIAYAGAFAQILDRAHARAGSAENIFLEDIARRTDEVAAADLVDEARNVDAGRARLRAWRVETEIATIGLDRRLMRVQRRLDVGKIVRVLSCGQALAGNVAL